MQIRGEMMWHSEQNRVVQFFCELGSGCQLAALKERLKNLRYKLDVRSVSPYLVVTILNVPIQTELATNMNTHRSIWAVDNVVDPQYLPVDSGDDVGDTHSIWYRPINTNHRSASG